MSVKVTVKLDKAKIDILEQAHLKALEMTMEAVLSDIKTSQVVPKETSSLEDSGFVDLSSIKQSIVRIIFDTPYARRMYWHPEYNFRKDKNMNAQGKWMESYLTGEKKEFIKETYIKFFKQLSKGVVK